MFRFCVVVTFCFICLASQAQLNETFDGDLSGWRATPGTWIINSAAQLQSNFTTANSGFFISAPQHLALSCEWNLDVFLSFNTSSLNYVDVYLIASSDDLLASSFNGYLVRIGGSQDEISLYRRDGSALIKLIDGVDGVTNNTSSQVSLRVRRSSDGKFRLQRDTSGSQQYVTEGIAQDATYLSTTAFGMVVKQSTSAFFQRHYFDNIRVIPSVDDTMPPKLASIVFRNAHVIRLVFSEPVTQRSAMNGGNYGLSAGTSFPDSIAWRGDRPNEVELYFKKAFAAGWKDSIFVRNLSDEEGNLLVPVQFLITYQPFRRNDLLITEVMADPSPPVGLGNAEYIELFNRSGRDMPLENWSLRIGLKTWYDLGRFVLKKDSFVILYPAINASPSSSSIPISGMAALRNSVDTISIYNPEGLLISTLAYTDDWYRDAVKKKGGWSLELTDSNIHCAGKSNWEASSDPTGGTPGRPNSRWRSILAVRAPPVNAIRAVPASPSQLFIHFDGSLDSMASADFQRYQLKDGPSVLWAAPIGPLNATVLLQLADTLEKGKLYYIDVGAMTTCDDETSMTTQLKVGLPKPGAQGLVINEVLFNPRPGGVDYVELYNSGKSIYDLRTLYLCNRNAAGIMQAGDAITTEDYYLYPKDYLLLTTDTMIIRSQYFCPLGAALLQLTTMPSFPDDAGNVVLADATGVVDELSYREKMHFALISDPEGVALERIDPSVSSTQPSNWHSAATGVGYGTPGYRNSQFLQQGGDEGRMIVVSPVAFSPDNDGFNDVVSIAYRMERAGSVANLTVFDISGRKVKYLVRNALMGTSGSWLWDGVDDGGRVVMPGVYVLLVELFGLDGSRVRVKRIITVMGR